jgi:hypothetical protein
MGIKAAQVFGERARSNTIDWITWECVCLSLAKVNRFGSVKELKLSFCRIIDMAPELGTHYPSQAELSEAMLCAFCTGFAESGD